MSMHHYAIIQPDGALRIVLPEASPSLNEFIGRRWYAKNKLKTAWVQLLLLAPGMHAARTAPATKRMRLDITRVGKRNLDRVNLWGGVKPVEDAMVTLGLLVDDSERWCDLCVGQRRPEKGEVPHTILVVQEAT